MKSWLLHVKGSKHNKENRTRKLLEELQEPPLQYQCQNQRCFSPIILRKHTLKYKSAFKQHGFFFCDLKNVCVCACVCGHMLKVVIKKTLKIYIFFYSHRCMSKFNYLKSWEFHVLHTVKS